MKRNLSGFTLIELLIVVTIILIISAMAVPHLLHTKITANETSALETLNTLNNSLFDYWTNHDSYPTSLSSLDSVNALFVNGTHSGYAFTYYGEATDSEGRPQSYSIRATPTSPGLTGRRFFVTDQSGLIRADESATPAGFGFAGELDRT